MEKQKFFKIIMSDEIQASLYVFLGGVFFATNS